MVIKVSPAKKPPFGKTSNRIDGITFGPKSANTMIMIVKIAKAMPPRIYNAPRKIIFAGLSILFTFYHFSFNYCESRCVFLMSCLTSKFLSSIHSCRNLIFHVPHGPGAKFGSSPRLFTFIRMIMPETSTAITIPTMIRAIFQSGTFPVAPKYSKIPLAMNPNAHNGHMCRNQNMLNVSKMTCHVSVRNPNMRTVLSSTISQSTTRSQYICIEKISSLMI